MQRGLKIERYSNQDICTIFCALGKIMGIPVSQNKFGHVLGHVYDLGNDPRSPQTDCIQLMRLNLFINSIGYCWIIVY